MIKSALAALSALAISTGLAISPAVAASGDTVKTIKERGSLLYTGHNGSYLGFAEVDDKGKWTGFDIEFCKALATATAILGSQRR